MAIQKVPRDPEGIEALLQYAALPPLEAVGAGLRSAERLEEYIRRIGASVKSSLTSQGRMHGFRVQSLFRATLVALGQFRLLTDEDSGQPFYDDRLGRLSPPDFRVIDREGRTLLVEVKNVFLKNPEEPFSLRQADVDAWRRWGDLTGAPVALALFWVSLRQWTLVGLERLQRRGNKYEIGLIDAMAANEMVRLGDCLLATRPPLTLRLHVEAEEAPEAEADSVKATVTGVDMLASGQELHDELERSIAWYFMVSGGWEMTETLIRSPEGSLVAVDLAWAPSPEGMELVAKQGFASVGMLSSLYAARFDEATLSPDGEVDELEQPPEPGELSALIPDDYWESADRVLPLWRLNLEPIDPGDVTRS